MVNLEQALDKAKEIISKMRGLDVNFNGRPMIDWLDFDHVKEDETEKEYIISVRLRESMFDSEKVSFLLHIDKETGELVDLKRVESIY